MIKPLDYLKKYRIIYIYAYSKLCWGVGLEYVQIVHQLYIYLYFMDKCQEKYKFE